MPENRQVKRNVGEGIRRLKISEKTDGEAANSSPFPDRPGEPDCSFYMKTGMCRYGANCRFNHPCNLPKIGQYGGELPERVGEPDCGYFLKTGTCRYGSSCKYHHPRDRHGAGSVVLNNLGLPMRQEEKSCPYYMRTGGCKFGIACKFNHPHLASTGTASPVPSPSPRGSAGSIVLPSSGVSFAGGIPSWSLQTYLCSPPSQGLGWEIYMGSLSGQVPPPIVGVNNLPERRDQPECRYFMNTGGCKYGSDCKYNHPRGKISELAASSLGPLGLPLRPGQAVCSYYTMYGLCKYGPTCEYDHPFLGYTFNYGMNIPTVSVLDPLSFVYPKNLPMINSYETSPSKSPKAGDWTGRVEAARNKRMNVKAAEESVEPAGSSPRSLSP